MKLPARIPGLKWATILWAIYAVIWIPLEGNLVRVTVLAVGAAALLIGRLAQRYLAGRQVTLSQWLLTAAILGLLFGMSSNFLTLGFMAVKTGLHAHGPEFSRPEIAWVLSQRWLWPASGLLAGLGLGMLGWRPESAPADDRLESDG